MAGAIQRGLPFVLEVIGTTQNSNPEITSTPVLNAVLGQAYSYQLDAFDADGDPVEYRLIEGPKGMTLNGLLGQGFQGVWNCIRAMNTLGFQHICS